MIKLFVFLAISLCFFILQFISMIDGVYLYLKMAVTLKRRFGFTPHPTITNHFEDCLECLDVLDMVYNILYIAGKTVCAVCNIALLSALLVFGGYYAYSKFYKTEKPEEAKPVENTPAEEKPAEEAPATPSA